MVRSRREEEERARGAGTAGRSSQGRVWRMAVYIRLSREDGNDESLSVTNQKKIIAGYLEDGFKEAFILVGHYIDDGETGTDYDRPAFRQMIRDMEEGRIDCIICKKAYVIMTPTQKRLCRQGFWGDCLFLANAEGS